MIKKRRQISAMVTGQVRSLMLDYGIAYSEWFHDNTGSEIIAKNLEICESRLGSHIFKIEAENDELNNKLRRIEEWGEAYSPDLCPEPDLDVVEKALEGTGISVASVIGVGVRRFLQGIKSIIEGEKPRKGISR